VWDKYLYATDRMEDDDRFRIGYSRMPLEPNKYFSGIPVNSNFSVVHVPTNVFDGGRFSLSKHNYRMHLTPPPKKQTRLTAITRENC
jgi:hypothetical protein